MRYLLSLLLLFISSFAFGQTVALPPDSIPIKDVVDFYEKLLESQHSFYSNLITVLIAIAGLLAAGTWLWNFLLAKRQITNEVEDSSSAIKSELTKRFEKLEEELIKTQSTYRSAFDTKFDEIDSQYGQFFKNIKDELRKELDVEILHTKTEVARIYANHNKESGHLMNAIEWWFISLVGYIKLDHSEKTRISINAILNILENEELANNFILENFRKDKVLEVLPLIPKLLSQEKKQIVKSLENLGVNFEF